MGTGLRHSCTQTLPSCGNHQGKAEKDKKAKVLSDISEDAKELDGVKPDEVPANEEKKDDDIIDAAVAAINAKRR